MKSIQKFLADWQREMGIKPNDDLKLRYFGFPGQRTRRKMMERKCDTCIYRKAEGCEKWECEYKERTGTHVELIGKQAAIDAVIKHYRAYDNDLLELIVFDIERLPSAETERKKGKWILCTERIEEPFHTGSRCSVCNFWKPMGIWNFCPNCGAKMMEVEA